MRVVQLQRNQHCTQNCISNDRHYDYFFLFLIWNKCQSMKQNEKYQLPKSLLPYALKSDAINKMTFASLSPTFITNSLQLTQVPMGNLKIFTKIESQI